jgi:hypothetical protein
MLTSVTIPDGVTAIGDYAFNRCLSLTSVAIPDSVFNVGRGPFGKCSSLTNIMVSQQNSAYLSEDGALFDKPLTTLVQCPAGLQQASFVIPNGITTIGDNAFSGCTNLASVGIPDSVINIAAEAFLECTRLTNVTIPDGVTTIGDLAFCACSGLTSVTIPASVTSLGNSAFKECSLTDAFFLGNAPMVDGEAGDADDTVFSFEGEMWGRPGTVYYVPGTAGWGASFGGWATALSYEPQPLILRSANGFGMESNGFSFIVAWATNTAIVVEACTNLVNPVWVPLATNSLVRGTNLFCDPDCLDYPYRYYRICLP